VRYRTYVQITTDWTSGTQSNKRPSRNWNRKFQPGNADLIACVNTSGLYLMSLSHGHSAIVVANRLEVTSPTGNPFSPW